MDMWRLKQRFLSISRMTTYDGYVLRLIEENMDGRECAAFTVHALREVYSG